MISKFIMYLLLLALLPLFGCTQKQNTNETNNNLAITPPISEYKPKKTIAVKDLSNQFSQLGFKNIGSGVWIATIAHNGQSCNASLNNLVSGGSTKDWARILLWCDAIVVSLERLTNEGNRPAFNDEHTIDSFDLAFYDAPAGSQVKIDGEGNLHAVQESYDENSRLTYKNVPEGYEEFFNKFFTINNFYQDIKYSGDRDEFYKLMKKNFLALKNGDGSPVEGGYFRQEQINPWGQISYVKGDHTRFTMFNIIY